MLDHNQGKSANLEWIVIINPIAGRGKSLKAWRKLEPLFYDLDIGQRAYFSESIEHLIEVIKDEWQSGKRNFLLLGGDGTHHHAINALINVAGSEPYYYAIYPCGTGNDWAKMMNIPKNPAVFASHLQSPKIAHQAAVKVTLSPQEQDRFSVNVTGSGYDSTVVKWVNQSIYKKYLRRWTYMYHGIKGIFKHRPTFKCISIDEQDYPLKKIWTCLTGINRKAGGGLIFIPHAGTESEKLCITIIENLSTWKILANIHRFYQGSINKLKGVNCVTGHLLRIWTPDQQPFGIQLDGEYLEVGEVSFTLHPRAYQSVDFSKPGVEFQ